VDGYKTIFKYTKMSALKISQKNKPVLKINGIQVELTTDIINIEISGDLSKLGVYCCGNVTTSESDNFAVKIDGNVNSVQTANGFVSCNDVTGSVETENGGIKCQNVGGNITTKHGKIYFK